MQRDSIDFHTVEEKHLTIHTRLINWSMWCRNRVPGQVQPMFRLYRPEVKWGEVRGESDPVDPIDAAKVQKGVSVLPEAQRLALNWSYVTPSNPRRQAQRLGVSMEGLRLLVRSGRVMLINRRI